MKQSDKTKSTLIAATLLVGAIFMLSVTIQHLPSTTVVEKPVNEIIIEDENQSNPYDLTEEIESIEETVLHEEIPVNPVENSFADAFKNARDEFGAGFTFVWNGNLYKTDRADDELIESLDTIQFVLDSTTEESTSAVNIEIAP